MYWNGHAWADDAERSNRIPGSPRRRRPLRDLVATAPAVGLLVVLLLPLGAAQGATPALATSGVATPGATLGVSGTAFPSRTWLSLTWDGSPNGMPRARTNVSGTFSTSITVPPGAAVGAHQLGAVADKIRSATTSTRQALVTVQVDVVATASGATPAPSATATPTATPAPTATATLAPTATATLAPTATATLAPTATATLAPTATPTAAATPTPTATATPSPTPTATSVTCGTLQGRIDAATSGSVLDLTGCTYAASGSIAKALTVRGGTIRPPSGSRGLLITASGVTLDGVTIVGTQATTYSSTEVGVEVEGRSGAPLTGIVIRGCTIRTFGYGGMYLRYVQNVRISSNTVTDGVYAGIMVLSGSGGTIDSNTVRRIGVVGSDTMGGNAYGIALTRGGGTVTSDPPSSDIVVSGNHVDAVPTWHAFDTHGGARITWTNNLATDSRSGIFITGASGSDGMVRSLDNDINGNEFDAPSGSIHYAITSVYSTGGYVRNNVTVGWPSDRDLLTSSSGDASATAIDLTVTNNTWR